MKIEMFRRTEDGRALTSTVWRPGPGHRAISSALLGGGIGPAGWVLNAQVAGTYARMDPAEHLRELAAAYGLHGPGVGMMTAASVDRTVERSDEGIAVSATVGLRVPTWAAAPPDAVDPELAPIQAPGTVNIVVSVPVPLTDAALVNAVITATEAKSQALMEAGYPCTGTASDAVCVITPETRETPAEAAEPFAGPRSTWGSRIARAVHAAVRDGALGYTTLL